MFRRDFLKSLAAAASGIAAAAGTAKQVAASALAALPTPAAAPAKPKPVSVKLSAKTDGYRKDLSESWRQVLDLIQQCTVVQFSRAICAGELPRYTVVYEYREGHPAQRTPFTEDAAKLAEVGKPLSVSVQSSVEDIDLCAPRDFRKTKMQRAVSRVEIEWITMPNQVV